MKNKTVLLGLSGGVDSAVAALLLKQKGYNVIGAFMINFSETKNELTGDCNYLQDKKDAQKIAAILNMPLKILNFEKEYKKYVIEPMFNDYNKGLTPNPDSLCNKIIKFPLLWKEAKKLDACYIATGHYAKIKKKDNSYQLHQSKDKSKDQTYFLFDLNQKELEHILFPISELSKIEVRNIAKKNNFPNYDKKGTSGICFVGDIDMKLFLKQKIKEREGIVRDQNGKVVGKHKGVMFYTIGERIRIKKGIELNKEYLHKTGKKLYISKKIIKSNTIFIAPESHPSLKKNKFIIKKINWISETPDLPLKDIKVRIRHLGELIPATIINKNNKFSCTLRKGIEGLAEGQSAVIYQGTRVLGGGEIRFK